MTTYLRGGVPPRQCDARHVSRRQPHVQQAVLLDLRRPGRAVGYIEWHSLADQVELRPAVPAARPLVVEIKPRDVLCSSKIDPNQSQNSRKTVKQQSQSTESRIARRTCLTDSNDDRRCGRWWPRTVGWVMKFVLKLMDFVFFEIDESCIKQ